jgi:hypothetical protein
MMAVMLNAFGREAAAGIREMILIVLTDSPDGEAGKSGTSIYMTGAL